MFEKEATEQVDLRNTHKTDAVSVKVQLVSINEQNYEKKRHVIVKKISFKANIFTQLHTVRTTLNNWILLHILTLNNEPALSNKKEISS